LSRVVWAGEVLTYKVVLVPPAVEPGFASSLYVSAVAVRAMDVSVGEAIVLVGISVGEAVGGIAVGEAVGVTGACVGETTGVTVTSVGEALAGMDVVVGEAGRVLAESIDVSARAEDAVVDEPESAGMGAVFKPE
jgi:hypothetical protein